MTQYSVPLPQGLTAAQAFNEQKVIILYLQPELLVAKTNQIKFLSKFPSNLGLGKLFRKSRILWKLDNISPQTFQLISGSSTDGAGKGGGIIE